MVVNTIAAPPEPRRDAAARKLLPFVKTWAIVTLRQAYGVFPAGTVLRAAPSSNLDENGQPKRHYLANNLVCQCPDYELRGHVCKHVRAILLYEESLKAAPKPKSYRDLFGVCDDKGCDEDRLPNERYCERHVLVDAF